MRRIRTIVLLVAIIAGVAGLAFSMHDRTLAQGGGATVYDGEDGTVCYIRLDALIGYPAYLTTTDYRAVVTPSGNTVLRCIAQLPDSITPPAKTLTVSGEYCVTRDYRITYDSQRMYLPNGRVMLTCHINGSE